MILELSVETIILTMCTFSVIPYVIFYWLGRRSNKLDLKRWVEDRNAWMQKARRLEEENKSLHEELEEKT